MNHDNSNILDCLSGDKGLCVDTPAVERIIDCRSGSVVLARDVLGVDYKRMMDLRDEISANVKTQPHFVCSVCEHPVTIASNIYRTGFYFRHLHDSVDCPIKTGENKTSEWMRAEKYKGAKESPEHIELKELIRRSVAADTRFGSPVVEKVWMGGDPRKWRKPDVSAEYAPSSSKLRFRIAFEAQLSTTFLKEMTERRQFYLEEGGFLFWIFKDFNFELVQMSKQDVFVNNRCNAFIVDEATTEESERTGVMHIKCLWAEPFCANGKINHVGRQEIVKIDKIQFNFPDQSAYYYDYDYHKGLAQQTLENVLKSEAIQQSIAQFKKDWRDGQISPNEAWSAAIKLVPELNADKYAIIPFINMLISAESGRPFGWNYENNVSVFHSIFNKKSKGLCFALCCAFKAYGNIPEDKKGDVMRKIQEVRNDLLSNGSRSVYVPDKRLDDLAKILFPTAHEAIQKAYTYFNL